MKKIVLSLMAACAMFAASNEQVVGFYSQMVGEGVKVSVAERKPVVDGIEAVVVNLSNGQVSQDEVIFTKGDLLFPDIIDLKAQKAYMQEIKKEIAAKNISKVYKNEQKENIITLGNDSKKPTIVMFSDPECPYCRLELEKIEATLKESNVKLILTPVHDVSSLQKSFLIYKDAASAKTDSDKIKILRKYFADDYKVADGAVSDADVKAMENLRQKYSAAGVRSVPFIINLSDLQK